MKHALMDLLEAVEHWLGQGFTPKRTIYLAFGHDEEVGGSNGAAKIAALVEGRGVRLGDPRRSLTQYRGSNVRFRG